MRMPCSDGAVSYRCIGMILRSMYLATPALFMFLSRCRSLAGNVGAIYAMGKLLFVTIVVVERFEQLFVEIFPSFESETFPENTGICMGGDQSGFDENGSRPAHRVYKVGFSVPPRFQYHSGGQYFVDGASVCPTRYPRLCRDSPELSSDSVQLMCDIWRFNTSSAPFNRTEGRLPVFSMK